MGTRQNQPVIEYGTDCPICTIGQGGSLWESGETPLMVAVAFYNLSQCLGPFFPPPNDKVFSCFQIPGYPCDWLHDGLIWKVSFCNSPGPPPFSAVYLSDFYFNYYFEATGSACPPDLTIYGNEFDDCSWPQAAKGGQALISYNIEVLETMKDIVIAPAQTLFSEIHLNASGKKVFKFCNRQTSTRIRILKS